MAIPAAPSVLPDDRPWLPTDNGGPFTDHSATFYYAWEANGEGNEAEGDRTVPPRFGFRVEPVHCNLRPTCHGGMLATFVDVVMAKAIILTGPPRTSVPTVNLSIDYLAPAPLGAWVEAIVRIDRLTSTLAFTHVTLHVGETMILRASAVYRIYPSERAL